MNSNVRNVVWYVAAGLAVLLAIAASWNGAVISAKASVVSGPPASIGEWGVLFTTLGGSALSALVAFLSWASKTWSGRGTSFVTKWLPVLQTLLDVENGRDIAAITIDFTEGPPRVLDVAGLFNGPSPYEVAAGPQSTN